MAADLRKARAQKLVEKAVKDYGQKSATVGRHDFGSNYYSTGSPTVDYMLGTGGVPDNAFTEVFGPPQIGKTTIFGAGVLRSVQEAGGLTATVATEPDFDEDWMAVHGVDPDYNIVYRPDTGEEAFAIIRGLVYNRDVDYVLFDSLGGVSSAKEQDSDKPQAFGNAALNSWGVRNIAVRAWKNRVGVMFINQIRDDTNARIAGAVKAPGGHVIEHFMKVRLQLKPGKQRYMIKVPSTEKGTEDLMIGREIRAVIQKNKAAQQLGKQAVFDFYHIETDGEFPFGFDLAQSRGVPWRQAQRGREGEGVLQV
jgi:RecA/RadA recombinase